MPYTQDNRLIAIETPLGKDALLLTGFHGTEGLSTPFSFELDLLSENHSIPFTDIIGKNVAVSVLLTHGKRYFHGLISRFSQGRGGGKEGSDPRFSYYSATMVPWLWLLTKTADSRIFQNKSVPDIVEKIFQEKGFPDFKNKLQGSYDTWDYCVQYRETDFNFISRLLEEEGIYYFFEHENNKHTLILADTPEEHKPCPKQETARYQISAGGWLEEDTISSLEIMQEITAGKYTLKDFNFETPNTDLKIEAPSQKALGPGEKEIYDYPGGYGKRNRGDTLANVRMQEVEAGVTTITGSGECRAFTSGYKFDLKDYYRKDMNNKAYVLTSLGHSARQGYASEDAASEFSYINNFTCIPFDVPYRPSRRTPKPVVEGVQTAIVVGPSGEEIYTEEHGRVKVQFHWDREGKKDDKSSCWIRVSHVHAGMGFGGIDIPRIGEEVIVNFIEGNPDLPIITGRVYNGTNKPPTGLPKAGMVSGLKSNSTPGGGGYNEMTMDDTKGKEKIAIHGQYNMDTTVGNNQTNTVGVDQKEVVGANREVGIGTNDKVAVGSNQETSIGSNHTLHVGGNRKVSVGGSEDVNIGGKSNLQVGGSRTETIVGSHTIVNPRMTITTASIVTVAAGSTFTGTSSKINMLAGSKFLANSGGKMDMKSGAALNQQSGTAMNIKSGAKLNMQSSAGMNIKSGAAIKSQAGGAMNLKAGGVITGKGSEIKLNSPTKIKGTTLTVK